MTSAKTANGTAFEVHGDLSGHVLVLIHGLGLTRKTWREHVPVLSEHYGVVSYDLFAHGESVAPPSKPTLQVYARQLLDLLNELNIEKATLVGFSLGGMINRRFVMDYPERVESLAIFNSPHERAEAAQQLVEQQAADASAGGVAATLDAAIERWFTPVFREQHASVISDVRSWVLANDATHYAQCRQVLANGVVELIRPNPPITHPTLVITGEHDSGSSPAMAKAISEEIVGSFCQIVPGLRHMGLVEQPVLFTTPLLAFLAARC